MALELAWGRLRRWFLRSFRPAYVREMAAKRQGDCPNCPHDIIDTRDLKFFRNVCGYWFKPEDDGFRARDRLGLARMGLAEVVCFSLLMLPPVLLLAGLTFAGYFWFTLPLAVVLLLWAQIVAFFRDPDRVPPADPLALVSPADGHVTHIDEVNEPDFPGGRAWRISIFLSVFDVHVNRLPRTGKVTPTMRRRQRATLARSRRPGIEENAAGETDFRQDRPAHRLLAEARRGSEVRRPLWND
jgi:phosphatidylserine decarboxylase